jgi:hypothetical protein
MTFEEDLNSKTLKYLYEKNNSFGSIIGDAHKWLYQYDNA